jgi:hypothetical protein
MSRSRRGQKPIGFEFNAKRVGNARYCGGSGRDAKQVTHRRERRIAKRGLIAFLALVLLCGCVGRSPVDPPSPEPDVPGVTEMDRYIHSFRSNIGDALGKTADGVDGLDEKAARDLLAANLLDAITKSHGELSAADAALSASGWTAEKFKAVCLRRQREVTPRD